MSRSRDYVGGLPVEIAERIRRARKKKALNRDDHYAKLAYFADKKKEECERGAFGNLMSCMATYFEKCPKRLKLACAEQSGPDAAEWVKKLREELQPTLSDFSG